MVSSDPSALINAVLCTVIVMALMLYRRKDSRHRPFVSFLACNIAASSHLHETLRLNKKVISPAYKHGLTMVLYSLKILLQPIDLA